MGPCPQHPESWDLGRQTGGGLCPLRVMVLWVSGAGAGLRPHCRAGSWSGSSKRWWEQGGLQADPSLSGQSGLHAEGPAPLLSTPPAMEDRHVQVGEGLRRAVLGSHAMTQKVPVALAGRTVHPPQACQRTPTCNLKPHLPLPWPRPQPTPLTPTPQGILEHKHKQLFSAPEFPTLIVSSRAL